MKHIFKLSIILLLFVFLAFTINSCIVIDPDDQVKNTNYTAAESFSYSVDIGEQQRLNVESVNSTIEIKGEIGLSQVKIEGEKIVKSDSKEDAEDHLAELTVAISSEIQQISVKTKQPKESHGRNYIVNYKITTPADKNIVVANVNGQVEIQLMESDITIALVNGDISLEQITGNIYAGLTNGNIYTEMILPDEGSCQLGTVNGSINLRIPKTTSANFSANIVNGNISVQNLNITNLSTSKTSTIGTIGDGKGTIKLNTVNGIISVEGV